VTPPPAVRELLRSIGGGGAGAVRDAVANCQDADWDVLRKSIGAAITPFIEYRLRETGVLDRTPASIQQWLRRAHQAAVAAALMRRHSLDRALRALDAGGIVAVAVKGAAFAATIYPQIYLRPMADIDLWVGLAALPDAVRCLMSDGWLASPEADADGRLSASLSQHRLVTTGSGVRIELHGNLHSLESLPERRVQQCWDRSRAAPELGDGVRVLSPDDALLHVSLHLSRSNGFAESQTGLLDIALLTTALSDSLRWQAIAADAIHNRVAVDLTLALTLAQEVWGATVPADYFNALGDLPSLARMRELALPQVWAQRVRLPAALEAVFRAQQIRAGLATFGRRIRGNVGSADRARAASLNHTLVRLRDKTFRYLRAWSDGELKPRELTRRARLAIDRGRLALLIDAAQRHLSEDWPRKQELFGVGVSVTTYDELTECVGRAIRRRRGGCVTALAVHGLVTAHDDQAFRGVLDTFEAIAPDGQPVRYALNAFGNAQLPDRVRGVDLAWTICRRAERDGVRVFLLGSRRAVVDALRRELLARLPRLIVVGCEPGLYGPVDPDAEAALVARINDSGADLLLVGMGCPYQERFVAAHRSVVRPVQVCVGSAFDVLSGTQPNAPVWMQRMSLEWLFRLTREPRRLWRRYLTTNSRFLMLTGRELLPTRFRGSRR